MQAGTLRRTLLGAILFVALLVSVPVLTLAFGGVPTARRLAHGEPPRHRPRAGSRAASRSRGSGLRRPHVRLARRVRRAHLARREAGERGRVHPLRGHRLVRALGSFGGFGDAAASARRGVVQRGAPPRCATCAAPRPKRSSRKLAAAVASYPHADTYRAWPGPNSNTFLAHLGREIPELRLTLPPTAIGKDYLPDGQIFARTPSGTGYQASIAGIAGRDRGRGRRLRAQRAGARHRHRFRPPRAQGARHRSRSRRRLSARRLWRAGVRWPPAKPVTRNLRFCLYSLARIHPIVVRETARHWRQGFWFVAARWPRQAGMTLLTRRPLPSDRRPMPSGL